MTTPPDETNTCNSAVSDTPWSNSFQTDCVSWNTCENQSIVRVRSFRFRVCTLGAPFRRAIPNYRRIVPDNLVGRRKILVRRKQRRLFRCGNLGRGGYRQEIGIVLVFFHELFVINTCCCCCCCFSPRVCNGACNTDRPNSANTAPIPTCRMACYHHPSSRSLYSETSWICFAQTVVSSTAIPPCRCLPVQTMMIQQLKSTKARCCSSSSLQWGVQWLESTFLTQSIGIASIRIIVVDDWWCQCVVVVVLMVFSQPKNPRDSHCPKQGNRWKRYRRHSVCTVDSIY